MNKIYLISGHDNRDSGATALYKETGLLKESELTIELKYLVKSYLQYEAIITDNDKHSLPTVINEINKSITSKDILLDLHFNSVVNNNVSGVETFVPNKYSTKEVEIGTELNVKLSEIMNIHNRGNKTPNQSARGRIGILEGIGHRLLLEVCFISNLNDVRAYIKHKHLVALSIAETLDKYVNLP